MDALKRHEIYRCISAPEVSRVSRVADASRPAISRFIGEFGGRDPQGQSTALSKKRTDSSPSDLGPSDRSSFPGNHLQGIEPKAEAGLAGQPTKSAPLVLRRVYLRGCVRRLDERR
ncbi:hypothetical protein ALC57_03370 [Trachymyrmex cornetzi]|uniref:Uncharacterized protein n=1 Tax=Trachymyrmex cornetzi TaxID=471704 RepID=A0A195EFK7_9HYME|nr:hypothetical protein ALC57_03370 [Trachymyrmex cornetzi]